jgi:arylsulfatase A-like enzyme
MSVNFMGMHQPTSPNKAFQGKSHLGNYSDKLLEMDYNIGRIMDAIRAEAPDTIVIHTADNGAWQDAWPDAGTNPYSAARRARASKGPSGCRASCGRLAGYRQGRSSLR